MHNWRRWLTVIVGALVVAGITPGVAHAAATTLTPATVDETSFSFTCSTDTAGKLVARSWREPNLPTPTVQDADAVVGVGGTVTQTRDDGLENTGYAYRCLLYNPTTGALITRTPSAMLVTTSTVNDPPTAVLEQPPTVNEDTSVTLTAVNSSDPDDGIASYDWDFGDGTSSTGHAWHFVDHIYTDPGTYTITVTVRDVKGQTDTDSKTITVNEVQVAPDAGLQVAPTVVVEGESVVADALSSSDANPGDTLSYTFDFGDGTTVGPQAGATAAHTYERRGNYTITVTVSDGTATDTAQVAVVVERQTAYGSNYKGVYKSTYGPIDAQRVFFTGAPQPFGAVYTEGDLTDPIHTIVSFKLSPQSVLAGSYDTLLANWAASFPTDRRIDWTFIHEPENQIQNGDFTFTQYKAAFIRIYNIVQANAPAGSDHHANVILMAYSLATSANRDWYNYYPDNDTVRTNGSPYVDVLAWDIYFQGSQDDNKDPGFDLTSQATGRGTPLLEQRDVFAVNAITGDDIAVAEFGYDYDTKRPAILKEAVAAFDGEAVYFTYFDLFGTTGPHQMDDTASQQYWACVITQDGFALAC